MDDETLVWAVVGGVAGVVAALFGAVSVAQNWRSGKRATERNDVRWLIDRDGTEIVVENQGQDDALDVRVELTYPADDEDEEPTAIDIGLAVVKSGHDVRSGIHLRPPKTRSEFAYLANVTPWPDHFVHWAVSWRSKLGTWTTLTGTEEFHDPPED